MDIKQLHQQAMQNVAASFGHQVEHLWPDSDFVAREFMKLALAAATAAQPADERAAFEAWAAKRAYDTTPNVTWPDLYAESRTQAVWEAWRDRAGATAAQPAIPEGMKLVPVEDPRVLDDLAALVARLAHSLQKAAPDSDLPAKALDYLKRHGLQGSPLRDTPGNG